MPKSSTATSRPLRVCDVCNQADDHPRHVQPRRDAPMLTRHLDCCAAQGCAVCTTTEGITNGARGPQLLEVIQSGVLNDLEV